MVSERLRHIAVRGLAGVIGVLAVALAILAFFPGSEIHHPDERPDRR